MGEDTAAEAERRALALAKEHYAAGEFERALAVLRGSYTPDSDFSLLMRAARWTASKEWPRATPFKIAFLGGGVLSQFVELIAFWLSLYGIRLDSYCSLYDAWRMDVLNGDGPLYRFSPDIVWFFNTRRDARTHASPVPAADAGYAAESMVNEQRKFWSSAQSRLPGVGVIQNSVDPAPERGYGNLDGFIADGGLHILRKYNESLASAAADSGVMMFDLAHLAECVGLRFWSDPAYWFHSKHPFSPGLSGFVAYHAARQLVAIRGLSKKAIVVDLDNTLWGGVVGDDGMDGIVLGDGPDGQAYQAFQGYLKALISRGIVLAVASKNDERTATDAFTNHPGMLLDMDDIAVFKANWRNKADNIREIAATLNLGLDSFVFVDDNPAERDLVRRELPMVDTIELPSDPSGYVRALDRMALFETVGVSGEDRARARMYKANAARTIAQSAATNLGEYLRGLEMSASRGTADDFHLSRMTQLVNKSNQFHLTTTRYGKAELETLAKSPDHILRWYSLSDKFGDYGVIAATVLRIRSLAAIIDTWAMSCRVLERGMEEFILRDLLGLAAGAGCEVLHGTYIPSAKNGLVADLYGRLGFSLRGKSDAGTTEWELSPLTDRGGIPLYITSKDIT